MKLSKKKETHSLKEAVGSRYLSVYLLYWYKSTNTGAPYADVLEPLQKCGHLLRWVSICTLVQVKQVT
jgi:hypothetical protein